MKIGDLIQELEKFPADYEVKVNCTVVRKGRQYTYRATLPRDHVKLKKNDEVVIINPVIIHGYGKGKNHD